MSFRSGRGFGSIGDVRVSSRYLQTWKLSLYERIIQERVANCTGGLSFTSDGIQRFLGLQRRCITESSSSQPAAGSEKQNRHVHETNVLVRELEAQESDSSPGASNGGRSQKNTKAAKQEIPVQWDQETPVPQTDPRWKC